MRRAKFRKTHFINTLERCLCVCVWNIWWGHTHIHIHLCTESAATSQKPHLSLNTAICPELKCLFFKVTFNVLYCLNRRSWTEKQKWTNGASLEFLNLLLKQNNLFSNGNEKVCRRQRLGKCKHGAEDESHKKKFPRPFRLGKKCELILKFRMTQKMQMTVWMQILTFQSNPWGSALGFYFKDD